MKLVTLLVCCLPTSMVKYYYIIIIIINGLAHSDRFASELLIISVILPGLKKKNRLAEKNPVVI